MEVNILKQLHKSKINFTISSNEDGFVFFLGKGPVDIKRIFTDEKDIYGGIVFLAKEAVHFYPESQFAKWWRGENNGN